MKISQTKIFSTTITEIHFCEMIFFPYIVNTHLQIFFKDFLSILGDCFFFSVKNLKNRPYKIQSEKLFLKKMLRFIKGWKLNIKRALCKKSPIGR